VVLPVVAAAAWGTFVAPKRRVHRGEPLRYAVELAVFAGGALSFWAVGQHVLAVVFAAAALGTGALDRAI
jgi:hypothetical protein